ncbi:MAG: fused MFS/spermidine synthase [Verrucomicrobia bacterium]|nr:fused MFS/spermidine synthase [Verrucomicrobiota bacterium]
MVYLFSATLFFSATLLFLVEPMVGKMILPLLGGTPAVWNTCMVFYQAVLLLGYAYAHFSTQWLGLRRQSWLHLALMALPLLVLPIGISDTAVASLPDKGNPILWLLWLLGSTVGLPLLAVSTTAPLLQKWFSQTRHRQAHDAYFLYAASNAGSMAGLFGYLALVEPNLRLWTQSRWWAAGYAALLAMTAACAWTLWRSPGGESSKFKAQSSNPNYESPITNHESPISNSRRARWVLLAFVPSSLMLGVTTYLTTDVAPFPLFWVLPLALYLATFILVFARRPVYAPSWMGRVLCLPALVLMVSFIIEATHPPAVFVTLHLLMFVAAALICHSELAKGRPASSHLTEFYLWMSVGGVLGGMFNALLAPLLFKQVLEYPLVMLAACALAPRVGEQRGFNRWDLVWPAGLGLLTLALIFVVQAAGAEPGRLNTLAIFAVPALLTYRFVLRPIRFSLCLAAILAASAAYVGAHGRVLLVERNFFGVVRVTKDVNGRFHQLVHGGTLHGRQHLDPARAGEPLAFYHRTGPAGDAFRLFDSVAGTLPPRVGLIGLGVGALATYAKPGQAWDFYEIDPAVERIACDPRLFTFISQCAASKLRVVLGDARLKLRDTPDGHYGMLVLDAFSSDSIPVHLLTREALRLYCAKVADGGLLAFHVSNRRLDLKPIVASLAADAGLAGCDREDFDISPAERRDGKEVSEWIVLSRRGELVRQLARDPRWQPLPPASGPLWTDDFSNLLMALRWK